MIVKDLEVVVCDGAWNPPFLIILFRLLLPSSGALHLFDAMPQEEVKVYHRCKIKKARDVGFDGYCRIDVLPDESLQHVLSFLPAREAVQTCVLARRWRHLWRSVPALRITSGPRWDGSLSKSSTI